MNKCTPKELARCKRYRDSHKKEIALYKKTYQENVLSSTLRGLCIRARKQAKRRAKENNLNFNISTEYLEKLFLKQKGKCPAFKIKLNVNSKEKNILYKPSLDRINNPKGYIEGNVMWISWKANTMKSNATKKELKMFAEWVMNEKTQ